MTSFALNERPHLRSIIVVDDFYKDPMKVREIALRQPYVRVAAPFHGFVCKAMPLPAASHRMLRRVIGAHVPEMFRSFQFKYFIEGEPCKIHWDSTPEVVGWSALVYMSVGRDGEPGTSFYRHKFTGLSDIRTEPDRRRKAKRFGCSVKTLCDRLNYDGFHPDRWDLLQTVQFRFNRLVVFPRNLFHSPHRGFGRDVNDARLVQLLVDESRPY